MSATPTVAKNKDRVLRKIFACLFFTSNEADQEVGAATVGRVKNRVWVCTADPSGGTGVATGDVCLDIASDDVYRYHSAAWYKISVEA